MKSFKLVLSLIIVILISACDDSNNSLSNTPIEEKASLSIKLVDNPGDYENVFVEVIDVLIKYESDDTDDNNGWLPIGVIEPGVYDLLELTGGVNLPLVENEIIEPGTIKQIRLVLGDSNSIVLTGESEARPLTTPSAQQSGLKVMVNEPILAGFDYNFILDFDVDESIVMAGNSGNIILKPVLRASLEINSGTIQGVALPTDINIEIEASNETVTASTFTDNLGNYEIAGLPQGLYTITITPEESSMFDPIILNNIEVTIGNTTILDPVTFE